MKVLFQLQVQYFSKIKFSCRLRSMGALYVESKCFYIGVGECSQTAEISLIAGWNWVRYYQGFLFCLPACTSLYLEYFLILRVPYCCEQRTRLSLLFCCKLCNPEICFWGINFIYFGEIKTKSNACGCEKRGGYLYRTKIMENLFVCGFKNILCKRESFYSGVFLPVV